MAYLHLYDKTLIRVTRRCPYCPNIIPIHSLTKCFPTHIANFLSSFYMPFITMKRTSCRHPVDIKWTHCGHYMGILRISRCPKEGTCVNCYKTPLLIAGCSELNKVYNIILPYVVSILKENGQLSYV